MVIGSKSNIKSVATIIIKATSIGFAYMTILL